MPPTLAPGQPRLQVGPTSRGQGPVVHQGIGLSVAGSPDFRITRRVGLELPGCLVLTVRQPVGDEVPGRLPAPALRHQERPETVPAGQQTGRRLRTDPTGVLTFKVQSRLLAEVLLDGAPDAGHRRIAVQLPQYRGQGALLIPRQTQGQPLVGHGVRRTETGRIFRTTSSRYSRPAPSRTPPTSEIRQLQEQIRRHDRLYHEEQKPAVSDGEYDALLERLRRLEEQQEQPPAANSPTQRVPARPPPASER